MQAVVFIYNILHGRPRSTFMHGGSVHASIDTSIIFIFMELWKTERVEFGKTTIIQLSLGS